MNVEKHTLSPPTKLDLDLLVHKLGQIEDIFLFGLLLLLLLLVWLLMSTATSTATTLTAPAITSAAATATTTTSERASFGHLGRLKETGMNNQVNNRGYS